MHKRDNQPREGITRRQFAKAGAAAAAALAVGTGGAFAYFTGNDEKKNRVSVADNIQIRVVEPNWDPESAKNVVPGQVIPKDPQIENLHDKVPGYLFLEIRVPTAVVSLYDPETESVLPPARTELFAYDPSEKWIMLEEFEDGEEKVRRYAWPDPVPAHGSTEPLFEEIVFANLAEVQGQEGVKKVTATGYGIQSHGFTNPEDAWQAYKLQNGIEGGEPTVTATIHVYTNFIESGDTYNLARVGGSKVVQTVQTVQAEQDNNIDFVDVELIESKSYIVFSPDRDDGDPIASFDVDEPFIDSLGMFVKPTAFLQALEQGFWVYSDTDQSLRIYKRLGLPSVGDTFEGLSVTAIGLFGNLGTNMDYCYPSTGDFSSARYLWDGIPRSPKSVVVVDDGLGFGVCAVDTFDSMYFGRCESMDLSKLDVSGVESMMGMFKGCGSLRSLDISGWDTSRVTNMSEMFYCCFSRGSIDLTVLDTSKVTDMSSMFRFCGAEELDLSSFDTSSVKNMSYMFADCRSATELDLSSFDTSSVTDMSYMFNLGGYLDGSKYFPLRTIYVSSAWSTALVKSSQYMFDYCGNLQGGSGSTVASTGAFSNTMSQKIYACIDDPDNGKPGLLTYKAAPAA